MSEIYGTDIMSGLYLPGKAVASIMPRVSNHKTQNTAGFNIHVRIIDSSCFRQRSDHPSLDSTLRCWLMGERAGTDSLMPMSQRVDGSTGEQDRTD
ncbi:hypothetical protein TNCT_212631 [Trichonephila clavata]|uniref:Uncharacterized protein n=1 Tax=Trichonephila clavata TaxID=2740835 RepID=A0A8X6GB22_TRICU|nr:hypothetical protein TNCT_212631 [Trichonephila clavata]